MDYAKTTPEDLAAAVIANIGKKTSYPKISWDGATRTAEHIDNLIVRINNGELSTG